MVSIYYSVYAQTCDYGDIHHAIYAEIRWKWTDQTRL